MEKHMQSSGVSEVVSGNWKYLGLILLLTIGVYANSLTGEFVYPDDIPGIVLSDRLDDFTANLKTFHLQTIVFSALKNIFGVNPLPFHIFSLTLHLTVVILAFVLIYKIWGSKVAGIAALIFAVHPVNTEAVTWISGSPYLINAVFLLSSMICYVSFRQTGRVGYLVLSFLIYNFALLFSRSPWVLVLPLVLIILDQFILGKKFSKRLLINYFNFLVFSILYLFYYLFEQINERVGLMNSGIELNQQTLSPIFASYPYTVYSLLRLYFVPANLKTYYDGNYISPLSFVLMLLVTLLFVSLIGILIWKKQRKVSGLLMLLVVLVAPSFSPIKITWSIAERYLYLGAIFWSVLIVLSIKRVGISKKIKWIVFVLIAILFSVRTITRNNDYSTAIKHSQAAIESAPLSNKPYENLGNLCFVLASR